MLDFVMSLAIIGAFVGFIGATLGVGGGFILVPLLTYFYALDAHYAIGTSLVAIVFTGLSSAIAYFKQGRLDWKLGLLTETSTIPGALIGSYLTTLFSSRELKILLAGLLVCLSISMAVRKESMGLDIYRKIENNQWLSWERKLVDSKGQRFEYRIDLLKLLPVGLLAGIASGFFGIGGGVITVPILYHLGVPIHIAIATSTLIVMLTALSGAMGHAILGHILWRELIGIVPGILLGTQFGAYLARKMKSNALKKLFAVVLIIMAILVLIK